MKTTGILALTVLVLLVAVPAFAGTPMEEGAFPGDNALVVTDTHTDSPDESDVGKTLGDAAATVERMTNLAAVTCGIVTVDGLAALPCVGVQGINLFSAGVSWIFGK